MRLRHFCLRWPSPGKAVKQKPAPCAGFRVVQRVSPVQMFAAEMKGPRDRPPEKPRGAFGQELPQALSASAASAAVTGPLKVPPPASAAAPYSVSALSDCSASREGQAIQTTRLLHR